MNSIKAIEDLAKKHGFLGVYQTSVKTYDIGDNDDLVKNANDLCPWARSVFLLVYPYIPFGDKEHIPAYYLASNKSYHAIKTVVAELERISIRAQNIELPKKSVAADIGVGRIGKNSLLYTKQWGSRVVLYTIATDVEFDDENAEKSIEIPKYICEKCNKCVNACPVGAIDAKSGMNKERCMRTYMEDSEYPDWVTKNITTYLGCEKCMAACPHNSRLGICEPSEEVRTAFLPERILSGDTAEARKFVGSNIKTARLIRDVTIIKSKL